MSHLQYRRRVARRRWLQFESMEQRNLMATYVVQANPAGGTTGDGSPQNPFSTIMQAVNAAKLNPGADEILVGSGTYNESVLITDTADLAIRGNAAVRPILNRSLGISESNANFVIENLNINSNTGIGVAVSNGIVPNLPPNGPFLRQGSLVLNNMNIQVSNNSTFWDGISVRGANQITASNVVLTNGRVFLNDVNNANLSQISVIASRSNALSANFVTQLTVDGLVANQPVGSGVSISNPPRNAQTGTPPVNALSVVSLSNVQIIGSGSNGLEAVTNISVSAFNCSFNTNLVGMLFSNVTSITMENVDASGNVRNGIFITNSSTTPSVIGRNVTANGNRAYGFFSPISGALSFTGGSFSNNTAAGMFVDNANGTVQLSNVVASTNGQFGVFLRNMTGNVALSDVTTNSNAFVGTLVSVTTNPVTRPSVTVSRGRANANTQIGMSLQNVGAITVDGYQANDNGGFGMNTLSPTSSVSIANAEFSRNSQVVSANTTSRPGIILSGARFGLTLTNITANNNPVDGIIIDNAVGTILASGISASGNPFTGLYVDNSSQPQRATLTLTDSNLTNNGKNGLLAVAQSAVTIQRSRMDGNGPLATQVIDFGTGAWVSGAGSVLIEDSTAIGTRVGAQSGAGMQIVGTFGPEVQIRRVNISNTQVHPLTTTSFGAGLVVTGSAAGVRIEDSTLNNNQLLDAIASRATIFSSVPLTLIRSQLLDNAGVTVNTTRSIAMQDSTIARTTGVGVLATSGGFIVRSTISGASSHAVSSNGPLTIEHSTLTGNATSAPPFVIVNNSALSLFNTIVAGNGAGSQAFSNAALTTSNGYNLLSNTALDWSGQSSDIIGNINNPIDPQLGPLTNNGGPTLTHMPLVGSPALEAGSLGSTNGLNDQRGVSRPQSPSGTAGGLPDIGAVEASPFSTAPTILLNTRVVSTNEGGTLNLRGRVSDIDGNATSLTASLGTIQLNADGTFLWSLPTVDDLSTVVTLTATDALGDIGTTQFGAVANNVAPTLAASYTANLATRTIEVQAIATDPSIADTFTFTVDWGDGTSDTYPNTSRSQTFSHVYGATWPSSIKVSVRDDDGASGQLVTLAVNAAPTITLDSNRVSVDEGSELRLTGRVSDVDGNLSTLTASQGTVQLNADGTFLWTLNGVDDLVTNVVLTASDAVGATSTASFVAEVRNVAPTLSPVTVSANWETRTITLNARVTDLGVADSHLFNIRWDDQRTSTVAPAADGTLTISQQYFSGSGVVTITVQAVDDDGAFSQTRTVAANVTPTIQLDSQSVSGTEGSPLTLTGRATDADGNLIAVTASVGLVQLNPDGTFAWTFVPGDDFNASVTLTASDVLGAAASATFTAEAINVAPLITNASATFNFASQSVALAVSFFDPATVDSHLFNILWGDGTGSTVAPLSVGLQAISASYQYSGFLPTVIMVQGVDDNGGDTGWISVPVNYPPVIQLEQSEVVGIEGSQVSLRGRVSDINGNLASLTSTLGEVQLNADGTFLWTFTNVDDLSRTVVGLTATDTGNASGVAEFTVQIVNATPTLGVTTTQTDSATRTVTLNTSVIDAGLADTHEVTIFWGDGTTSSIVPGADRKVTSTHQYGAVGGITIVVRVTDDDGQSSGDSFVVNTPPTIQLNAPSVTGNEGSTLRMTGRVSDSEGNLVSLVATFGAIQLNADGTFIWTYSGTDDLSTREVGLTATDAFGAFSSTGFLATVNNVAPTLGSTTASLNIATRTVTINTSVIDPGLADTHLFTIQWGDGTTSTLAPSANRTLTASRQYSVLGPTTITVRVADDDGGISNAQTLSQAIPGFVIRNRELFVYGSNLSDTVSFNPQSRGQVTAVANFGGTSLQYTFVASSVDTVLGYLAAGNDTWNGSSLAETQMVFGESGNDQITTGAFDDILLGGDGADTLNGGEGRDLLFGGLGADSLFGQSGGDVLVAGRYERENDLVALRMLRNSWTGSGNYQTRVGRLRNGVGTDPLGAIVRLSINQITDDAIDQLFGGSDSDWFLTNSPSEVRNASRDESIN